MFKAISKSRLITIGGTLACALGVGVLMQRSVSDAAPVETPKLQAAQVAVAPLLAQDAVSPEPADVQSGTVPAAEEPRALALESITLTRAEPLPPAAAPQPEPLPEALVAIETTARGGAQLTELPSEEAAPAFACEMDMTATPQKAALVQLQLSAPCMVNERFTLHHNGMMITGATDDAGHWQADIPALSEKALFIVAFTNGDGAVATADVPLMAEYDRYVVQWKGYSGLQIHALEYGADYGQDGHVWYKEHRNADVALRGEGGFILRLGEAGMDDALMAEIYSFPSGHAQRSGDVQISLESEITRGNCGRDVEAQALIKTADGSIGARDLKLAIPECNAVGDFIVLKNLYEDLKIAGK